MNDCKAGDDALFELPTGDSKVQIKFQRNLHMTAVRAGVKITCENHFLIKQDFSEITPVVKVTITKAGVPTEELLKEFEVGEVNL